MRKKRKQKSDARPYVVHYCKQCNNCWIDKDLTNVKTFPPTWKLCEECCKKLGIDFDSQKPTGKDRAERLKSVAANRANLKDD